MRLINLILGDIRFQWKYGFYFIYIVLIILYACILSLLPNEVKSKIGIIMVFSDPAAMGMFFMGAIILLEKSERVLNSIAISPVTPMEYIFSKVISIGIIATIVGVIISIFGGRCSLGIIIGIFLGSILFSLCGLIVGANIKSLNQYLMATIPFEFVGFIPAIAYLFGFRNKFMLLHPGCAIIHMFETNNYLIVMVIIVCIWIIVLLTITHKAIVRMFSKVGGVIS